MEIEKQIKALREQLDALEKQVIKQCDILDPLSKIESIGKKKIQEILEGDMKDGVRESPLIDWGFCQTLGMYAKNHFVNGEKYIWPYNSVNDLKNSARQLLDDTLSRCINYKTEDLSSFEDDDYMYYNTCSIFGRIRVDCKICIPKKNETVDYNNVRFDVFVEIAKILDF